MKRQAVIPLFLLLLAGGCAEDAALPALPVDAVILAFGDSLTRGNGARPEESYPAVLARLSGRQVINAGVSGEESEAGLKRLPGLLAAHEPHLLILCHGGNDFLRKKDQRRLASNLKEMIRLARSQGSEVVLLGVPKPGLFLSSADVYEAVAADTGVVFIEDLVADVLSDASLKSDAVHPNRRGYELMARGIHQRLSEAGAW